MSVKAGNYKIENVGKKIKESKKKFTWELEIEGKKHLLELWASLASGKKRLCHNKKDIYEEKNVTKSW